MSNVRREPKVGETVVGDMRIKGDRLLRGTLFSVTWHDPPVAKVMLVDGTLRVRQLDELEYEEPS